MLGLQGFWVPLGYILTILSAILCVVYGIVMWNKEGAIDKKEMAEEKKWQKDEVELETKL
jgi:hypothetical protein